MDQPSAKIEKITTATRNPFILWTAPSRDSALLFDTHGARVITIWNSGWRKFDKIILEKFGEPLCAYNEWKRYEVSFISYDFLLIKVIFLRKLYLIMRIEFWAWKLQNWSILGKG